ncbi:MAG TPA: zinc-binding dehydrogenase [Candidatus Dormibacteraeota bacterium]|jgi:NADPH2:quinone reductase|nr:zinc-binding dehydrogenase [Candidatus Dormibacteraeota bacterium]
MKAIVAARTGGPEVLELREVPDPEPGEGQALVRVRSAGVNFADTLAVSGRYHASAPPPLVPGLELAGEEVGTGRPVLGVVPAGAYAEVAAVDRRWLFPAEGMDLGQAGAWPLVTFTAWLALGEVARLRPGESVLVTAGAGGLGSAAVQVARALGAARVVAVASTPEKRAFARGQGADHAVGYEEPFPEVDVVVDGVGGEAAARALEATRPLGRVVLLGMSSGTPPELPGFGQLRRRNVGIMCFSFGEFRRAEPDRAAELVAPAVELLRQGRVRPPVGRAFGLAEAAAAHRLLLGRGSMGKLVLRP